MGIASVVSERGINDNPVLLAAKARFPTRFYAFLGLDHAAHFRSGAISTPSLAEQVDRAIAMGADGIKLIETKPTHRKMVDIPIDGDYYAAMFARIEEAGLPVLWHVADPEEFWDPELIPAWAKEAGWAYDETFAPKEQLYSEVENVLARHSRLKVIFAHFYFLSADLPRASALLERFANVHFDLAPGVEMLYNMSHAPGEAREFFVRYSDRIIFGTDSMGDQSVDEARARAGMVRRWLESSDEFRVDKAADVLLGQSDEGTIRGMYLPKDALARIYAGNFERLVGRAPKRLDTDLAIEESARIADEIERLGGDAAAAVEALELLEA